MNRLFYRWIGCGVVVASLASNYIAAAAAPTGTRGYTGTQLFSTVGGDKDQGEPNHAGEPGGASSWFFYRAPRSGAMMVDTKGSSFDTVLAVYIGPGTSYDTLTNVAANNNNAPGQLWSKVAFNVTSNTMYYIAVDGVGGTNGTVKLNYILGDPLVITQPPLGLVRRAGANASFSVAATGATPLAYQWLFRGAPITGATQATLTLPSVQVTNEGAYTVRVQDAISQQSTVAALTVCPNPPATNRVGMNPMLVNGSRRLRITGHAAAGSVLEATEDLVHWAPVQTNLSPHGLFTLDDSMDRPQRYFRIRLAQ